MVNVFFQFLNKLKWVDLLMLEVRKKETLRKTEVFLFLRLQTYRKKNIFEGQKASEDVLKFLKDITGLTKNSNTLPRLSPNIENKSH